MPTLPLSQGDIYFGDAEKPLPNWRKAPSENDDDEPLDENERRALVGMLGFDPQEIDEQQDDRKDRSPSPSE